MESNRLSLDDGIELNDEKALSGRLDDDDWEVSEKLIGNRRKSITYRGSPDSVAAFKRNFRLQDGEILEERMVKRNGNHQQILKLIIIQSDPNKSAALYLHPLLVNSDYDKLKVSTKHPRKEQQLKKRSFSRRLADLAFLRKKDKLNVSTKHPRDGNIKDDKSDVSTDHPKKEQSNGDDIKDGKSDVSTDHPKKEQSIGDDIKGGKSDARPDHPKKEQSPDDITVLNYNKIKEKYLEKLEKIFSRRLADLGISPMEPPMFPGSFPSRMWVEPLFICLMSEEWRVADVQAKLSDQSYNALLMMSVIMVVNIGLVFCKTSYFWLCFWLYWICILCIFAYMHWLRYKVKLIVKFRVSIADWAEKMKKDLPDWCADFNGSIDLWRFISTRSLGFVDTWIFIAKFNLFFSAGAAFYLCSTVV